MAITTVVYFGVATHVTNSLESWAAPPCELPKDSLHANATAGTSHCYWPKTGQKNDHELEKTFGHVEHSKCSNKAIHWGEIQPFLVPKTIQRFPKGSHDGVRGMSIPPVLASVSSSPWIAWGMGRAENHLGTHNSEKNSMIVDIVSWKIWAAILCFINLYHLDTVSISNTNKTAWLLYVHVRLPLLSSDATRI